MGVRKYGIDSLRRVAAENSGQCLSDEYHNVLDKYRWRCGAGYEWEATFGSVLHQKSWCPYCSGRRGTTIKTYRDVAESYGGRCLTSDYINAATKLEFECAAGHRWWMTPNSVQQEHWCKTCARERIAKDQRLKIDDLQRYAASRNGKLLSTTYRNRNVKLHWQCSKGHVWYSTAASTYEKAWCPECGHVRGTAKRRAPGRLNELNELANSRGGKCLSNTYQSTNKPLDWQCAQGHKWAALPINVKNKGSWCPTCGNKRKGKRRLRTNTP